MLSIAKASSEVMPITVQDSRNLTTSNSLNILKLGGKIGIFSETQTCHSESNPDNETFPSQVGLIIQNSKTVMK